MIKICYSICFMRSHKKIRNNLYNKTPKYLRFYVVYEFACAESNASYVGETHRHIKTKISKHLNTDKMSYIFQHLEGNDSCKFKCNESCFKVTKAGWSAFRVKVKNAPHIKWRNRTLNVKKYQAFICICFFTISLYCCH